MNDDVESHQLPEGLIGTTKHIGEVGTIIESGICIWNIVIVLVAVMEDDSGNTGDTSTHIKSIFVCSAPVLALVDTLRVGLCELGRRLASKNTHGELGHWVHVLREALNESFDTFRELSTLEKLCLELLKLRLAREFTSKEEPESSLGKGLGTARSFVTLLTDLVEILASVGNTVEVMELGSLVKKAGHASHTTDDLRDSNIAELGVAMLLLELV